MNDLLEAGGTRLAMPRATWKRLERELSVDLQLTDRLRLRNALDARQRIRDGLATPEQPSAFALFFPTAEASIIRAALDRLPATWRA